MGYSDSGPIGCDCSGTNQSSSPLDYICGDPRLGPVILPKVFPMLSLVSDYDRFGGEPPGVFLAKWTNRTTGQYIYPPQNGFQLDVFGKPILGNMTLVPGTKIDRFGSEYGEHNSVRSIILPPLPSSKTSLNSSEPIIYLIMLLRKFRLGSRLAI